MLNEARQRLGNVAKDPARYPALMEGLMLQVCLHSQLPELHLRNAHSPALTNESKTSSYFLFE